MIEVRQQYLRTYPVSPDFDPTKRGDGYRWPATTKEGEAIRRLGWPYEGLAVVLWVVPTHDHRNISRFGVCDLYGIGQDDRMRLFREGSLTRDLLDQFCKRVVFYNPDVVSAGEIAAIQTYALRHGYQCLSQEQFVKGTFYRWVYEWRALCIGQDLAADLAALATDWTYAEDFYAGGFRIKLCSCKEKHCYNHPSIRMKAMGKPKVMVEFVTTYFKAAKRSYEGRFLVLPMLGRGLLGRRDATLPGLCESFGVPSEPHEIDPSGPITEDHVAAAAADADAMWAVYREARDLYSLHGIETPIWKVYSVASLAKGYRDRLRIPKFLKEHPVFPLGLLEVAMNAYHGGIVEMKRRLEPVEIRHCDFLSSYTTGSALMDLQQLLLAETLHVRECAEEIRAWLRSLKREDLLLRATWKRLRVFVTVRPYGDQLPLRSDYGGLVAYNTALPLIVDGPTTPYCLAHVLASWVRTGRMPDISQAWEIVPRGQVKTNAMPLFGNPQRVLDLSKEDLGVALVNERLRIKEEAKTAHQERRARLDGLQQSLKTMLSSGIYGVHTEMNPASRTARPKKAQIIRDGRKEVIHTHVLEEPGSHFAGPIGVFVPAAGQLLLALAIQLADQRGISYMQVDTDSGCFERPDGMDRETFYAEVDTVREALRSLSPYEGKPHILRLEDQSFWQGKDEPLYGLGISSKRYVEYNRRADGTYRIRKFTSHGTGTWDPTETDMDPLATPEPELGPDETVEDIGGPLWMYRLWYWCIKNVEEGETAVSLQDHPALQHPAMHTVVISTYKLLKQYRCIEGIRPFSRLTVLPALSPLKRAMLNAVTQAARRPQRAFGRVNGRLVFEEAEDAIHPYTKDVSFYAPRGRSFEDIHGQIRRSDTHELVDVPHTTMGEAMEGYFQHGEAKMADPEGIGVLQPRRVRVSNHVYMGKETDELLDGLQEDSGGILVHNDAEHYGQSSLAEVLSQYMDAELIKAMGVPKQTIRDWRRRSIPRGPQRRTLHEALATLPIRRHRMEPD